MYLTFCMVQNETEGYFNIVEGKPKQSSQL